MLIWLMWELKVGVYFPGDLSLAERVHNRFGGMRDVTVFLWWYSRCELKKGAGSGNFDNEREWDFLFLLGWDAGIVRGK